MPGMKYISTQQQGDDSARIGILLCNLGTPDAPTPRAVRRYLKEFLSDPRVVEAPRIAWWLILNGIILNTRPARSARAYRSIWTDTGSPLLVHTRQQASDLQAALRINDNVIVNFAMRYGNPSITEQIQLLWDQGVRKLLILPLYPQYSCSTTASVFDAVAADLRQRRWLPELRFVSHYHHHHSYIAALAQSIRQHWRQYGRAQQLIFSYHGEPQRYMDAGDPYYHHCLQTSHQVAALLELEDKHYTTSFQSRFGREPWLQPYTDTLLKNLPASGCEHVQIICPGFAADCLETLEEIALDNRRVFISAGGQGFEYIPCLNASGEHIDALSHIVRDHIGDWLATNA